MFVLEELVGNAEVFPVLAKRDYFNHAGVAPMPRPVADAIRGFVNHFEHDAFCGFDFAAPMQIVRHTAAAMLNARDDEIAVVQNTSEAVAHVALGLDLSPGDHIVSAEVEYPANIYPWMEACRRSGAHLVRVAETVGVNGQVRVTEDALLDACDNPRTRVLAISHVQWGSGQRMDLSRLGKFCNQRGILFSVDAIQSMGVVPIDVKRDHIDFLQAGGHKWMLGTMGAGVMYIRRDKLDRLRPNVVGWGSVVDPLNWEDVKYTLQPDAKRYEYGSPSMASVVGLGTGMQMLAAIGIARVHARVKRLGDRFAAGVAELGYHVVTPRAPANPDTCSGAVCFVPNNSDAKSIYHALSKDHATELAFRCGRVRFSPHFYNTDEQVDRLLEKLAGLKA